ncbi:MAG: hypothetical protein H5U40_01340, partial [Polyangiaceae bacterium]|nr:hypothetical protein [Polyangiaceae bacterium]
MSNVGLFALALSLSLFQASLGSTVQAQSDEHLARQFFETGRAYFERAD